MATESEEKSFRKLLNLINTNMPEAIVQSRNLSVAQREAFQKYLANLTLHTESARYRGR